jgi:hypothetical protein
MPPRLGSLRLGLVHSPISRYGRSFTVPPIAPHSANRPKTAWPTAAFAPISLVRGTIPTQWIGARAASASER